MSRTRILAVAAHGVAHALRPFCKRGYLLAPAVSMRLFEGIILAEGTFLALAVGAPLSKAESSLRVPIRYLPFAAGMNLFVGILCKVYNTGKVVQ